MFLNYDDKFNIKIKGLIQLEDEHPKKILIKKEYFDGDYYTIVNTLLHYAAILYLDTEENPKRLDFNDWANKAYIEAVAGGRNNER